MIGRSLDVDVGQPASRRPPSDPGPASDTAAAGLARPGFLRVRAFKFRGMRLPRATPAAPPRDPGDVPTRRAGTELGVCLVAAGECEYRTITDQFPELPTTQEKKREKKNPQMPYKCVGQSGVGHARWNYDFHRRRPTPACAGVGRQISRIFPLRYPSSSSTNTVPGIPTQPANTPHVTPRP